MLLLCVVERLKGEQLILQVVWLIQGIAGCTLRRRCGLCRFHIECAKNNNDYAGARELTLRHMAEQNKADYGAPAPLTKEIFLGHKESSAKTAKSVTVRRIRRTVTLLSNFSKDYL